MTNRDKEGNLEIDAGKHFINPNKDFTISMINAAMIVGIVAAVITGVESKCHPIEKAYNFLINYINYFN